MTIYLFLSCTQIFLEAHFLKVLLLVSQIDMHLTEKQFDVSFPEPLFSEQWEKRAQIRRETKVHISPPGLGMMGVPGGPPPPGGP